MLHFLQVQSASCNTLQIFGLLGDSSRNSEGGWEDVDVSRGGSQGWGGAEKASADGVVGFTSSRHNIECFEAMKHRADVVETIMYLCHGRHICSLLYLVFSKVARC